MSKLLSLRSILSLVISLVTCSALAQSQEPAIRLRAPQEQPAVMVPAPPQPKVPFQLTPQEQQRMDQLLFAWERESNKVKLFKCAFTRWDYDKTFGPKQNDFLMSERHGEIKFRAPDNGTFKEVSMKMYDPASDKYAESTTGLEHWVCDGKAIYQFKPKVKTLEIAELPPEMRGKAITEGPLPFIFGAKAKTLNERYWIRETTPKEQYGKQIWLEAWPKFREQAANFKRVEVILGEKDLMPVAMQVYLPNGKDRTAYLFEDRKVNDKFNNFMAGDFLPPMTPLGWKKVVLPTNPPAAAQAPVEKPLKQAARAKNGALR
jgi:TIGR03009 family protein